MIKFLKLTAKSGHACLINVRHIVDISESTSSNLRLVTTIEADGAEMNQVIPVTETLYQIEQALDDLAEYEGSAVSAAAHWPAEEPGGGDGQ